MANLETDYAGVREYIGARYVPVFADPVEWSDTRAYEPLTIVTYQGASYTSARYVPTGIPISDESYWVRTFDFDAQVEAYRTETRKVASDLATETQARISGDDGLSSNLANETQARISGDDGLSARITANSDKLATLAMDGVSGVTFENGADKGYMDMTFQFADGTKRKLRVTDQTLHYFDATSGASKWDTTTARLSWYPLDGVTDLRCAFQNNVFVCDLSGLVFDWVKTEANDWQQIATQEQMRVKIGSDIYNAYAVANVNYESGNTATLKLDNTGLWVRMSGTQSGSVNLYASIVFLAYIQGIPPEDALNPAEPGSGNAPAKLSVKKAMKAMPAANGEGFWVVRE